MTKLLRKISYHNTPETNEWNELILSERTAYYIANRLGLGLPVAGRVAFNDEATAYNMVFVPLFDARILKDGSLLAWGGGNGDVYVSREMCGGFAFALPPSGNEIHPNYVAEKLNMYPDDPNTKEIASFLTLLKRALHSK